MSLLGSVGKVLSGGVKMIAGTALGTAVGGPIGGAIGGALASSGSKLASKGMSTALTVAKSGGGGLPSFPGKGLTALGAGAAGAISGIFWDQQHKKRKRRRKGITAKDLMSFKRVARLVDKYAKPVHHFRNIKK
jgi:hypothetical protein